jgi:hypothetical protein
VPGGGEAGHVQAGLGGDDRNGDGADAGDLIEALDRRRERGGHRLDPGDNFADSPDDASVNRRTTTAPKYGSRAGTRLLPTVLP